MVHIHNSLCHPARIIAEELGRNKIQRALQPPYSTDLIPCHAYLFGFLKEKLQKGKLSTNQEKVNRQSPAAIGTSSVSSTQEKDAREVKTREVTSGRCGRPSFYELYEVGRGSDYIERHLAFLSSHESSKRIFAL
jgi:hypothetical protein